MSDLEWACIGAYAWLLCVGTALSLNTLLTTVLP